MTNFLKFILCCLFMTTISQFSYAQKTNSLKEGYVSYEVDVNGAPQAAQMLKSSSITMYFKNGQNCLNFSLMAGIASINFIWNTEDQQYTLLTDIPTVAERTAIRLDSDSKFKEMLDQGGQLNQKPGETKVDVKTKKGKRKRIAGYSCHKNEITSGGTSIVVYTSPKLKIGDANQLKELLGANGIEGFPLGFEMEVEGIKVFMKATEVSKKSVDSSQFEIPSGYKEISLEEFKEQLGDQLGTGNGTIGL
ncbi:MAG: DUF4412 domain-containing protein [Saprospiraceae bacterium]|nr:DUF4412 domain-containing protein [Saprospiraceae bacterium]